MTYPTDLSDHALGLEIDALERLSARASATPECQAMYAFDAARCVAERDHRASVSNMETAACQ